MTQLENHVIPVIGSRPVVAIAPPELLAMLRRVTHQYTATRIRELCGAVFKYGVATGKAERNPAADLAGALPTPKVKHRPALTTPREFGQFLRDLKAFESADPLTLVATRLALLTFVRSQELRLGQWAEVDFDAREWRIPAGRMKAGKGLSQAHVVPLSSAALATLADLRDLSGHTPHMFPNLTGKKDHMSENTIGALLKRMGYQDRQTLHGFRASARSLLSESGKWSVAAMERQLDHAERNKVVAAYARSEHLAERVEMMEEWGRMVTVLEAGANVIELQRAA
jgi:integrase